MANNIGFMMYVFNELFRMSLDSIRDWMPLFCRIDKNGSGMMGMFGISEDSILAPHSEFTVRSL